MTDASADPPRIHCRLRRAAAAVAVAARRVRACRVGVVRPAGGGGQRARRPRVGCCRLVGADRSPWRCVLGALAAARPGACVVARRLLPSCCSCRGCRVPVPAAFLLWTGPVGWRVWAGTAAVVVARVLRGSASRLACGQPWRAAWSAPAAGLGGRDRGGCPGFCRPCLPGGDEPHYLIITQSLLLGRRPPDREQPPARATTCAYFDRGRCGRTTCGAAGTARSTRSTRRGCRRSSLRPSRSAATPAWSVSSCWCRRLGRDGVARGPSASRAASAAWFGWAAVTVSAPFFFHAFPVYPDATGAAWS